MTGVTIPSVRWQHRRGAGRRRVPVAVAGLAHQAAAQCRTAGPLNPRRRGGVVVFEVRFRCTMNGDDLELLRRQLDMTTHVEHKLPADPNSPGHAQLDQDTSLLLERGPAEDEWILQARTWGRPAARTVRAWQVQVAAVAHQIDPGVAIPERLAPAPDEVPQRPVGRAANRRLAAVRRRLAGLPCA